MNYISHVLWEFLVNWMSHSQLFPDEASTIAPQTDALYLFLTAISVVGLLLVLALVVVFAIKYNKEANPVATQIEGSVVLEATWTLIPLALFLICFLWGALLYFRIYNPPPNAMNIYVIGKQWMWKAEHPGGQHEINALHVPTGRPVQLTLISQDVFHSFSIPAFRVKREVIPGRYQTVWFQATKPGTYHLFCTQYCGTLHSQMIGEIVVQTPEEYQAWSGESTSGMSLAQNGERLFTGLGCAGCHSGDAQARGPNLAAAYGTHVALSGGGSAVVDEAFLRDAILNPSSHQVAGFTNYMPSYQGQVSEDGIISLVEYIKQLNTNYRVNQTITSTATYKGSGSGAAMANSGASTPAKSDNGAAPGAEK